MAILATENASSSSSSVPPPSTSGCKYEYDVFLSFRGTDTRNNFTDHLYNSLKQEGIFTFRDDERLEQGTEINSGLLRAIDESKIAVVVLSKQYASSSWCLIELAKIVECMDKKKLTVLPVFHYVDPSDVRYQRRSFAKAFAKHENRFKDKIDDVKTWRAALTEVANLSGWYLKDNSESEVIKKIIQRINSELDREVPFVSEHLVGMDSRVKEMLDLCLGQRLNCVRLVGICGMGGIGKTTLAREIYNRIFCDFEVRSFIADVREESESRRLVSLQKNILSKILMGAEKIISDVEEGKKILRKSLCNKKVLIVLDDVNDDEQLKALAGKDWFGPESIIIVTSRDSHLLNSYWDGVIDIYRAKGLNDDEALELFSLKAFKKRHPEENYVDLSMNFVSYANGLPLALRVLGSSLFGKTLDAWRSARDKLEAKPNRVIMDVLEMSVVGLDDTQRDLFLDIAFLFKDMDNYCTRDTLESLGHYTYDIDVLQDKSLITIASNRALWMHDLLKEMGQDIVRRESPEEPGKRSRLWSDKDVMHVLTSNAGTKVVKGIMLNMPVEAKERLSAKAFSNMKILRFLKIGYVHTPQDFIGGPIQLPQGLSYLSNELRIIDWYGYPLKFMPTSFQPKKLVELRMHCSSIEQLWKGIMILNELKLLDLSDSRSLIEIPDLSGASNLKQLILQRCTRLYNIHASIGDLKQLIRLNLNGCKNLSSLPNSIGDLKQLIRLNLNGCKNLSSLPNSICSLMSLKTLTLSCCSRLEKLPENLGNIEGLEKLNVGGTAIRGLPSSFILLKNLKNLSFSGCDFLSSKRSNGLLNFALLQRRSPDPMGMLMRNLSDFCSLTILNLSYCNMRTVPDVIGCLSSLTRLNLRGNNFVCLPKSIIQLSNLERLHLSGCTDLRLLPKLPLKIEHIDAIGCTSLETLPIGPESILRSLWLFNCVKLNDNQGYGGLFSTTLRHCIQRPMSNIAFFFIPGSEIPKWFSHQSEGNSVNLQGPPDFMGIAICAAVSGQHHKVHTSSIDICFQYDVIGSKISYSHAFISSENFGRIDLYHLLTTYFHSKMKWENKLNQITANGFNQIDVRIESLGSGLEVTKCGARLVYEQDIEDLKQNMAGSSSCSITPYEDDLDDSAIDTKIKQTLDDYDGDGAGPSGKGSSDEVDVPHPKWIRHPNLIENWIGNSNCEEEESQ